MNDMLLDETKKVIATGESSRRHWESSQLFELTFFLNGFSSLYQLRNSSIVSSIELWPSAFLAFH